FAAIWPQASPVTGDRPTVESGGYVRGGGAGEIDPIQNLSRFHYLKEVYLDSATSAAVLSVVPTSPDTNNPLPIAEAAETIDTVRQRFPEIPPVVATHKGFALPGFDQRCATPRDIGYAAKHNPKVRFLVYHSGYDIGDHQGPYRGDAKAKSNTNTVDGLIKS